MREGEKKTNGIPIPYRAHSPSKFPVGSGRWYTPTPHPSYRMSWESTTTAVAVALSFFTPGLTLARTAAIGRSEAIDGGRGRSGAWGLRGLVHTREGGREEKDGMGMGAIRPCIETNETEEKEQMSKNGEEEFFFWVYKREGIKRRRFTYLRCAPPLRPRPTFSVSVSPLRLQPECIYA